MKKIKVIEAKNNSLFNDSNELSNNQMKALRGGLCINYTWDSGETDCGIKIGKGTKVCFHKVVTGTLNKS